MIAMLLIYSLKTSLQAVTIMKKWNLYPNHIARYYTSLELDATQLPPAHLASSWRASMPLYSW